MGVNARTRWGFGDFDLGELGSDPTSLVSPPMAPAASVNDLITGLNARNAALTNVDPITALGSKLQAVTPSNLLLFLGGALLLVALMPPQSGGRR